MRHMWDNRHTIKYELQQRNRLGTDSSKKAKKIKPLYSRETAPLAIMQLQVISICLVRMGPL